MGTPKIKRKAFSAYKRKKELPTNIFYVYLHHTKSGEVVYVGKGKNGRAYEIESRAEDHRDFLFGCVSKNGTLDSFVTIYKGGLSEQEAFTLENSLITCVGPVFNKNIFGMQIKKDKHQKWVVPEKLSIFEMYSGDMSDLEFILDKEPEEFIKDSSLIHKEHYHGTK